MNPPLHGPWRALARLALPLLLGLAHALALAGAPRDRLTLLVPDDHATTLTWQARVWQDAAADEGIRLELVTDSALLAMGPGAAQRIAGLIVPDSAHQRASAAVVAAIKQYAYLGGRLMLVYDAGVLDERGFFPLAGNSRFADLVGVDYVFWNNGQGAATMVGFGPVVGTRSRLDSLSLPPGKYVPYQPPASLSSTSAATAFVPAATADPGGTRTMWAYIAQRLFKRAGFGDGAPVTYGSRVLEASRSREAHIWDWLLRPVDDVAAVINSNASGYTETTPSTTTDTTLHMISGYGYGALGYFSYVTTGEFPGTVYLSSPEHGLVAGKRSYGSGELLFVNLPLGYFKAVGTDSAPLQGFLSLFAREQVGVATLSTQPKGKGGLIYNWHVDDGDDLNGDVGALLSSTRVLHRGPFSIHLTAGPDVINPGDGAGMALATNARSQDMLQRLSNTGRYGSLFNLDKLPAHAIGSHGGWIHDFWGANASESNAPQMTPLLQQNFDAIERVTGRRIREYSSPVGNTPTWAVKWLEARGVVAMYLVGDGGAGLVRSYRNGERLTSRLWTSPVTPLGKLATFEEFDLYGLSNASSGQWLLDLQSFVVNRRTNRMVYNHPPGALGHLAPVNTLLSRADNLAARGRFAWYTMSELADFSQRRVEATWTTSSSAGLTTFSASHASSLADLTWLLPKSRFNLPWVLWGLGWVSSDESNWIVTALGGTRLSFVSSER